MSEALSKSQPLTLLQEMALSSLCERYQVAYDPSHYQPTFDLPPGYVAGWVGGFDIQRTHPTIYVGCSPGRADQLVTQTVRAVEQRQRYLKAKFALGLVF